MRQDGSVSVIIPVYNGESVLPAQLRALAQQSYRGDFEVIVSDNGSTDATRRVALEHGKHFDELRVVEAADRRGPSHARNVGASAARGGILLFCDADDVVDARWIDAMATAMDGADLVAGMGEASQHPESHRWSGPPRPPQSQFRFLPWQKSANLGFRREVFTAIGGFDENRLSGEDADICWRAQLAGYRFAFVPDAMVVYRERGRLRDGIVRQFGFGRAAPGLYGDFISWGAPPPDLQWLVSGSLRHLLAAPRALLRNHGGRRWLVTAAGLAGRWVGTIVYQVQLDRSRERSVTGVSESGTEGSLARPLGDAPPRGLGSSRFATSRRSWLSVRRH